VEAAATAQMRLIPAPNKLFLRLLLSMFWSNDGKQAC
jgi:hypothetical protein